LDVLALGGGKPEDFSIKKTEAYNTPIYANGITNNGLCGFTNKPVIVENSITVSARGTVGFVCNRYEAFCPIGCLIVAIPNRNILLEFLSYALAFLLSKKGEGTSIPQLTKLKFSSTLIPLPPLPEQKRIVAKIESIFNQLKCLKN
jgi:type I restriction enzyme S subunit